MSVITRKELLERIQSGSIVFEPGLDEFQLKDHSVDLRLGFTFAIPKQWKVTEKGRVSLHLDYHQEGKSEEYFDVVELKEGQCFELLPEEYVLASTYETIGIPNDLMAVLYPRSSTNRRGLSVDLSGIIDSGYQGRLLIPIRNSTRSQVVKLYPGERICQVVFQELSQSVESPTKSKYHDSAKIELWKSDSLKDGGYVREGKITELKQKHAIKNSDN